MWNWVHQEYLYSEHGWRRVSQMKFPTPAVSFGTLPLSETCRMNPGKTPGKSTGYRNNLHFTILLRSEIFCHQSQGHEISSTGLVKCNRSRFQQTPRWAHAWVQHTNKIYSLSKLVNIHPMNLSIETSEHSSNAFCSYSKPKGALNSVWTIPTQSISFRQWPRDNVLTCHPLPKQQNGLFASTKIMTKNWTGTSSAPPYGLFVWINLSTLRRNPWTLPLIKPRARLDLIDLPPPPLMTWPPFNNLHQYWNKCTIFIYHQSYEGWINGLKLQCHFGHARSIHDHFIAFLHLLRGGEIQCHGNPLVSNYTGQ